MAPEPLIQRLSRSFDLRPLLILAVLYGLIHWLPFGIFGWLQNEDGVMEWASFAALVIAASNIIRILRRSTPTTALRLSWGIALLLCIVFAGEEIAWGERLHGFGLEAIRSINTQDETTLHNIRAFQSKGLLHLGWSVLGLILGAGWSLFPNLKALPSKRFCLYFLIPSRWYLLFEFCRHEQACLVTVANHQEIYEFLIALGFCLHTQAQLRGTARLLPTKN